MKYSIGYWLPDELDSAVEVCRDYSEHISNVYFSFANEKSGRLPLCGATDAKSIERVQLEELRKIKDMGKSLTLLFNASCYGEGAVSLNTLTHVLNVCKRLKDTVDIDRVTTTSPFIAEVIKGHFGSDISVTASVNMRIASIKALEQLQHYFDGYYLAKECNRNLTLLDELLEWCRQNGKAAYLLANSGCMPHCAFQTFHDNLVAHQDVNYENDTSWMGLPSPCHRFISSMKAADGLAYFLSGNWIRPEDIRYFENRFEEIKLATRMHDSPRRIISAYVRGRYKGNLLDLTEPSFSRDFPYTVIDNTLIPDSFFDTVSTCDKKCTTCGYCKKCACNSTLKIY